MLLDFWIYDWGHCTLWWIIKLQSTYCQQFWIVNLIFYMMSDDDLTTSLLNISRSVNSGIKVEFIKNKLTVCYEL